jgi:DNA-directed RNA polymerase specialized sigma24 family protein
VFLDVITARGGPFLVPAHVRTVEVPQADRRELERRVRDKGAPAREVERARIVLLAADEVPGKEIAAIVGCAEGTVVTCRGRARSRHCPTSCATGCWS